MGTYEMWKSNMDYKTFKDFITDLYIDPIKPTRPYYEMGKFHLRKDVEPRNFHRDSLTENNPWDYFIGNGIDPGKTKYSFYIYITNKRSRHKQRKIDYLKEWGFELFDIVEARKETLIKR